MRSSIVSLSHCLQRTYKQNTSAQYHISGDVQEPSPMHFTVEKSRGILLEIEEMESVLLTRYCSSILPSSSYHETRIMTPLRSVASEHSTYDSRTNIRTSTLPFLLLVKELKVIPDTH